MQHLFRQIPSVDKLLKQLQAVDFIQQFGHQAVVEQLRKLVERARQHIQQPHFLPSFPSSLLSYDRFNFALCLT